MQSNSVVIIWYWHVILGQKSKPSKVLIKLGSLSCITAVLTHDSLTCWPAMAGDSCGYLARIQRCPCKHAIKLVGQIRVQNALLVL